MLTKVDDRQDESVDRREPIQDIGGRLAEKSAGDNRRLKVGIEIGGLTEEEKEELRESMAARRGGGGMGGMGGGGRGGMRGGMGGMGGRGGGGMGRSGMRKMFEDEIVWLSVVLQPA